MSYDTFGTLFRVTTFGESHGVAVGVVIDGMPSGFELDIEAVQRDLNRRRPGASRYVSAREESDRVEVLSGLFEGRTTGAPVAMLVRNESARPENYDELKELFRPGHADYGVQARYGIRDHRGGGRLSGRETVARVAAGAVAKQFLESLGVEVSGFVRRIGGVRAESVDLAYARKSEIQCPDPEAEARMIEAIESAVAERDSIGGLVEVWAMGVPAGLGDPVFMKLDAQIAWGCMSIGGVKGVEIGDGFALADMRGSEANDQFKDGFELETNRCGGIVGGISAGTPIVVRLAVKPTSSIGKPQRMARTDGSVVEHALEGRHDPCLCPRIAVVAEAMVAIVLLDAWLRRSSVVKNS